MNSTSVLYYIYISFISIFVFSLKNLAWQHYSSYLKRFYWKEHNLLTRGYFCATIGNANNETIQKYIESQV